MKPTERDEILVRLDERVKDIREDTLPKIEQHLERINSRLDKHGDEIVRIGTLQKERNKPSKKSIAGYIIGGIAIVVALFKAFTGS